MLRPPFATIDRRLFALRAQDERPDAYRLPYGDDSGVPLGITLGFDGPNILARLPRPPRSALQIEGGGTVDMSSRRLHRIAEKREPMPEIRVSAGSATYRLSVFTAMGYLTSIVDDADGAFTLLDILSLRHNPSDRVSHWAIALKSATTLDLATSFPLLIETGRWTETPAGRVFAVEASAPDFVWLGFDSGFAEFMMGKVPDDS
jgi:hypothetical protein